MPGPAPKDASQRASRKTPKTEWRELRPLDRIYLPDLPDGEWSPRTRAMWSGFQADPVTQLYGEAEIAQCIELAYMFELAIQKDGARLFGEFRQWVNILGLSPKGKHDMRLKVIHEDAPVLRIV